MDVVWWCSWLRCFVGLVFLAHNNQLSATIRHSTATTTATEQKIEIRAYSVRWSAHSPLMMFFFLSSFWYGHITDRVTHRTTVRLRLSSKTYCPKSHWLHITAIDSTHIGESKNEQFFFFCDEIESNCRWSFTSWRSMIAMIHPQ